jgi:acyl transferase domain-containing protein/thioesterase domain-containing protein
MSSENDIAIVGMALRVPGARSPSEYWQNLCEGREALQAFSEAQLRAEGVSAALLSNPDYVRSGMPLAGFDEFDAGFFGFSPMEAAILDPQHRQFFEVSWEALESAGCDPKRFDGAIGVFAGCGAGTYFFRNVLRNPELLRSVGYFLLRHTGNDKDFLATRVSYAFDLRGPSINVQTACSTSLVATHMAVQSLLARETDLALAGGVTIELPQHAGYLHREGEILSRDGHCRAFDHRASGTVFGSGVGVVALRRLEDALRDGDHIHAVIRGSAVNNDGASKMGYLAPSVEGQAAAIAEAIALAGIASQSIGYVECHGTGTPMGDPIEVAALVQAFDISKGASADCLLGSVKSNIGHLDTAAGVAGLIKAALCLEHGAIPPTINFEAPNPALPLSGSAFRIADQLTAWPRGATPRRAAVNSLGVGGTNAFVVLEEAPAGTQPAQQDGESLALVFSAKSAASLDAAQSRLAEWLRTHSDVPLGRIAHTLGRSRQAFEHRRVLAARSTEEARQILETSDARRLYTHLASSERLSVVFLLPGGGAQYTGMARGLYESMPAFRRTMDEGFAILEHRFGTNLRPPFLARGIDEVTAVEKLQRPSVQLPLVFLIEYALASLWDSLGVRPDALLGHSMGENTAACIAGVLSLEDGLGLVLLRGQLMDEVTGGGMLSVPMSAADLKPRLGPELDLAAANSPLLSIASGPVAALDELQQALQSEGIEARRVRIDIAAHSRMLDGILDRFGKYLSGVKLVAPRIPIVSNFTGRWLTDAEATDPQYWVRHLRNTVRFAEGVQLLLQDKSRLFVEVGPGAILGSFVRQSHEANVQRVFASLRHPDDPVDDATHVTTVAARLWASGLAVPEEKLWPGSQEKVPLPNYAFEHSRYWIEPAKEDVTLDEDSLLPQRQSPGADWLWQPRWLQQGIPEGAPPSPKNWCVFHQGDPIALACVAALRGQGHTVVEVLSGDALARVDEHRYSIAPEAGSTAYEELLQRLVDDDQVPDRILHTWLLTRTESFRPGQTFLHRNQVHGFYSLFHLARAFARRAEGKHSHWTVLSNGSASVAGEPLPYPEKATVQGPCLVIPREFPEITCSFVDVAVDDADVAEGVLRELEAPAASEVLALRRGVRWLRYLAPAKSATSTALPALREGGTYLITGGFGGISAVLAEWLARSHRASLVLLSRTPLPDREDWERWLVENPRGDRQAMAIRQVRLLEGLGSRIHVAVADIAVAEQFEAALTAATAELGPVHGVFHAAGVLHDDLIALKSERDIEEVFSPKLYGTLVLDRALARLKPDFLLLFSSASAYVAPAGQVDYVGASAFLNTFAESCRGSRPWRVVAMDWGIWRDVGMATGHTSVSERAESATARTASLRQLKTDYPLFDLGRTQQEGREQVHWIEGRVSTTGCWVADEHRLLDGHSVFPGSGYVELVRAAIEAAGLGTQAWSASKLHFIEPFPVPDGEECRFRIQLRGTSGQWHFQLGIARITAANPEWVVVATCDIELGVVSDVPALDVGAIASRCTAWVETSRGDSSLRTRQEAHLKFGPRWRVLQSLKLGEREGLAELRLNPSLKADLDTYRLHPGLLDIATGCAMDLIPGYAEHEIPRNLWVPVSYGAFHFIEALPPEFVSWISLSPNAAAEDGVACFNVVLAHPDGRPLAAVRQLTVRRLDGPLLRAARDDRTQKSELVEHSNRATATPGEQALQSNRSRGITTAEGVAVFEQLFRGTVPPVLLCTPLRPQDLMRQAEVVQRLSRSAVQAAFARPRLVSEFEAPRDELERSLAETWGRLLGIQGIGIRDSFFELGGHSLIAVRLFNEISERHHVDLPLSALIQNPDISSLATLIRGGPPGTATGSTAPARSEAGGTFLYAVPIKTGPVGDGTPVFIVAGMFGNVLNLSHLAGLLGEDRAFFALQARGLYGSQLPHESFEEMARDYIEEVRRIQGNGPYLLGGFSGGGLVAFEMARQLELAGERTAALILLDTPIRQPTHLSLFNKVEMWLPGLRKEGLGYIPKRLKEQRRWREELAAAELQRREEGTENRGFHSQRVGDAFLRSLAKYKVSHASTEAILFRPRPNVAWTLHDGRQIDNERNVVLADNGWTGHVASLRVVDVPGNHDSMVLEPNVRVLASTLRRMLRNIDGTRS